MGSNRPFFLFLFGAAGSLRGLEGVDLLGRFLDFHFNVRCRWTVTQYPSAAGIGVHLAVFSAFPLNDTGAPFTLVQYGLALTANEPAALLCHEGTLSSGFNGLANHSSHLEVDILYEKLVLLTDIVSPVKEKSREVGLMN